jgi:hypothetical protein
MSDKDVVLDGDALANEGVARDFAVAAHTRVLLNLDKRPDFGVVTDFTAV